MAFSLRALLLTSTLLAAASSITAAQSGGFTPGELIFSIGGPQAPFPDGGTGIARIDPISGQINVVVDFFSGGTVTQGVAYDSFRDRVIFSGVPFNAAPGGLWASDAQGVLQLLLANNSLQFSLLAPGSGGRIYYRAGGVAFVPPLRYLDALNVEHSLLDSTGLAAYTPPWVNYASSMIYDATTNSLIVAIPGQANSICSGVDFNYVTVHKLALSADGSRVIAPESCAQYQLSIFGSVNSPVGIGTMTNGHVLVCIDPNASGVVPVFLDVNPLTLNISQFAATGTTVSAKPMKNGTYSSVHNKGVCVDISTHVLRLYSAGEIGDGTVLSTSAPISPAGNAPMSWCEVRPGQCGTNNLSTYCVAKTSSHGCVPSIFTVGAPSMTISSGFTIQANSTEAGKPGLFFYSTTGTAATPFSGGILCLQPVIKRLSATTGSGTATCSGTLFLDFNAVLATTTNPALVAGANVYGQFWFRDPPATFGAGLSNAVKFHICP